MPDYVPNTIVRVLKNVPLDDTYSDTIKFNSAGEQSGYFAGKAKYTFTNMTYQRVNNSVARPRGPLTVRVPMIADNLYDCNYIMFQNSNYGQKWFYAFIKQVNYINPENTEIVYEIDYMQTFMMDFEVKECFVEREHVASDLPFEHICPEPIGVGEYIQQESYNWRTQTEFGRPYIVAAVANDQESAGTIPYGQMYGGIYSGVYFHVTQSASDMNSYLEMLNGIGKIDMVVSIFMTPIPPGQGGSSAVSLDAGFDSTTPISSFGNDTYRATNFKVLTYPFTYYKIRSTSGDEQNLKPELCDNGSGDLKGSIYISSASEPNLALVPSYQKDTTDWTHAVQYAETVQCAWSKNAYATWQAQQQPAQAMKMIGAMAGVVGSLVATAGTGGAAAPTIGVAATHAISTASNVILSDYQAKVAPDVVKGSAITGSINIATGNTGFDCIMYRPHPKELQKIDEFFNQYGYEVDAVKVPEMDSRANFNYVKTRDANITGSVPVEGMAIIKAAFNSGIRLWHGDITRSLLTAPNPIVSHETNKEVKSK